MIKIGRFVIKPITIGQCLELKSIDLSNMQLIEKEHNILAVVSNFSSIDAVANAYNFLTSSEIGEIRSNCLAIHELSKSLSYSNLYSIIFNLNGNTFSNWESLLNIPLNHLKILSGVIDKYNDRLEKSRNNAR